jgi:sensor histidine kinase YesM
MKWSLQKITIHLICCMAFLMLPIIVSPEFSFFDHRGIGVPEIRNLISSTLTILFFYANYIYLIPTFYHRKKYIVFVIITVCSFLFITVAPTIIYPKDSGFQEQGQHEPPFRSFDQQHDPTHREPLQNPGHHDSKKDTGHYEQGPRNKEHFEWFQLESTFIKFLFIFVLSLLIKTRELWEISQDEKRTAELSSLRLQVNPHFLFNTLNSIYSLALEKSDKTPEAIVKLSELMRYVTTEVTEDFVPLEKELNYISNYIELQRIRLGDTVQIDYVVSGNWAEEYIAPLLLIPFVENAFKYGVNPETSSRIGIDLSITDHQLSLTVTNNKIQNNEQKIKSGTGLTNAQKRLKLVYPGMHKLVLQDSNQNFNVKLTLQLA